MIRHNHSAVQLHTWAVPVAVRAAAWASVLGLVVPGCASTAPRSAEIPVWTPAYSELVTPRFVGRARISYDRPLPDHLTMPLCEELSLVTITRPADWADVRRRLQLEHAPLEPDLSQGMIVGIQANVGERADGTWPVHLESVQTRGGDGCLKVRLPGGLYYPLLTARYLELAYVPGLRNVRRVEISPSPRVFIIHSPIISH